LKLHSGNWKSLPVIKLSLPPLAAISHSHFERDFSAAQKLFKINYFEANKLWHCPGRLQFFSVNLKVCHCHLPAWWALECV
jgi:hypothetical protein